MADNFKDILAQLSSQIDEETLLLYLQGKLPAEKKHEVEKILMQDEFNNDALEGLQEIKDKQQIQYMVEMLNRDLKKKTEKKKQRREKLKFRDQPWLYVSILIIILLIVLSYMAIHRLLNQ